MASLKSQLEGDNNVLFVSEVIKDRLYFVTLKGKTHRNIPEAHYFSTDDEFHYNNFYNDFGPLNILAVHRYNEKLNFKLKTAPLLSKKLVQFTAAGPEKRTNAAFLIGTYCLIHLNKSPKEVSDLLSSIKCIYTSYQDASPSSPVYTIRLIDCFNAFKKALCFGLVNMDDFDAETCEKLEKMYGGDMSWIVPQKLLAFSSPVDEPPDRTYHTPKFYADYFQRYNVKTVVRLNLKTYDSKWFTSEGIAHHDLFFPDGGVPTSDILERFLEICENSVGAVAVHCKAGLGRTGCLIGAYLIKHYRMTALEAIAWMRICRSGCVIGSQQTWLVDYEPYLWSLGDAYRTRQHGSPDRITRHKQGIYSKRSHRSSDDATGSRLGIVQRPPSLKSSGMPASLYLERGANDDYAGRKAMKFVARKAVRPSTTNSYQRHSRQ